MKMPVCVWKKVVRIQRQFLWGGVRGGNKINWVKWSVVCKEKCHGGLGVRDARIVNFSLLAKWRWRLLQPGLPLWKEVLIAKYGNHIAHHEDLSNRSIPASSSSWWKDICSLDNVVATKNWLAESLVRKVGNGASTFFWLSNWINGAPLSIQFPRLFSLSTQKECKVEDFFIRDGEDSRWSFTWRRALFQWEIALLDRLLELLGVVNLTLVDDVWRWTPDPEGIFSVSSAYKYLAKELCTLEELDSEVAWIF
jgi:hypothetical protein